MRFAKAAGTIDGADGQQLAGEQNNSMVIHKSVDEPNTILACGEMLDLVQDGTVIVPLRAVGDSQYTGVGTVAGDSGDYSAFLLEGVTLPAPPEPTSTPVPTNTPVPTETPLPTETPTPAPTNTPPPTNTPFPPTNTPVPVTVFSTVVGTRSLDRVVHGAGNADTDASVVTPRRMSPERRAP